MSDEYQKFETGDICWVYYDQTSYECLVKVISNANNEIWYNVEVLFNCFPVGIDVICQKIRQEHATNLIKCNILELAKLRLCLDNAIHDIIKQNT
jgi:hypothetical protein